MRLSYYTIIYKVVIRNLNHSKIATDILDVMAELGHAAMLVVNIKKNHRPLQLFQVKMALKENTKEIFEIKTLIHNRSGDRKTQCKTQ